MDYDSTVRKLLRDAGKTRDTRKLNLIANDLQRIGAWDEAAKVRAMAKRVMEEYIKHVWR